MTKKQVWRYFCDHCKKGGLSAGHMKNHEKHCTANPERICRMHKYFEEPQVPMSDMLTALRVRPIEMAMNRLRHITNDCPMCILSAIRQSGIGKWDGDPESQSPDTGFDFKKELTAHWETINELADDHGETRHYYA